MGLLLLGYSQIDQPGGKEADRDHNRHEQEGRKDNDQIPGQQGTPEFGEPLEPHAFTR
ncbi:hypothetical protein D3C71_1967570 [compost metagenome]